MEVKLGEFFIESEAAFVKIKAGRNKNKFALAYLLYTFDGKQKKYLAGFLINGKEMGFAKLKMQNAKHFIIHFASDLEKELAKALSDEVYQFMQDELKRAYNKECLASKLAFIHQNKSIRSRRELAQMLGKASKKKRRELQKLIRNNKMLRPYLKKKRIFSSLIDAKIREIIKAQPKLA